MMRVVFALLAWVLLSAQVELGFPPGTFQDRAPLDAAVAAGYIGPGDVANYGTAVAWYSCARAFTAVYASGTQSLCTIERTSDSTTCILKTTSSGFADQVSAICTGATQTIAQFCNATTCGINKMFDQSGSGNDALQATQALQPLLVLTGTGYLSSLPGIDCGNGISTILTATAGSITQAQPLTLSLVMYNSGAAGEGGYLGGTTGTVVFGAGTTNNLALATNDDVNDVTATATAATWHAVQGLLTTSPNTALKVDAASDVTGNGGTGGLSTAIRTCRAGSNQATGFMMEGGIWAFSSSSGDRTNMYNNQHGASGYNGGV